MIVDFGWSLIESLDTTVLILTSYNLLSDNCQKETYIAEKKFSENEEKFCAMRRDWMVSRQRLQVDFKEHYNSIKQTFQHYSQQ